MSNEHTMHLREEEFIPFLEAKLSLAERSRMEAHIATCAKCRMQLDGLRSVLSLMDDWTAVEPSPSFDAAVRQKLEAEAAKSVGWAWFGLRPAFGASLVLAALLAGAAGLFRIPVTDGNAYLANGNGQETVPPWEELLAQEEEFTRVENEELMDNYELLQQFDILFETAETDKKQL